jgi:hypothetical protein
MSDKLLERVGSFAGACTRFDRGTQSLACRSSRSLALTTDKLWQLVGRPSLHFKQARVMMPFTLDHLV